MLADSDLRSVQEARTLLRAADEAQRVLAAMPVDQIDRIVGAMAAAGRKEAIRLAEMAVAETTYGKVQDKVTKNIVGTEEMYKFIGPMKVLGILNEDRRNRIIEIGAPMGVVVGIIPCTNPTSTVFYKSLISVKAGNAVVFSPHPAAKNCIIEATRIVADAAVAAGAPEGLIACLTMPSKEGTNELMSNNLCSVILATGGTGLVKAAYSSGKPAFGVGPGNVPVFIERTADIPTAVTNIITSKTFDYGTICSSEQAVVTERVSQRLVKAEFTRNHGFFLNDGQIAAVSRVLVQPNGAINARLVGHSAHAIAEAAGVSVPDDTTVLLAELDGIGAQYPLSCEKLSPVLAFYTVEDWREACDTCMKLLYFGGVGHTISIHSNNDQIVREFGLKKPIARLIVNAPSTQGAIGVASGLPLSFTLGCGTWGGNITSDNVTATHLTNRKRIAYGLSSPAMGTGGTQNGGAGVEADRQEADLVDDIVRRILSEYRQ